MRRRRRRKKRPDGRGRILTPHLIREAVTFILLTAAAVMLGVFVTWSFGMREEMNGSAMEPLISNGSHVLVNRFSYQLGTPERGDIIVFSGGGGKGRIYIRRVGAVSGDSVQITDGVLFVNSEPVDDTGFDKMEDPGIASRPVTLAGGEYFVLGDNRNESEDSRSENIGIINRADIIGKVWRVY